MSLAMDEEAKARFMSKVDIGGPDDCWLWTGTLDKDGYGVMGVGDRKLRAHRLSWAIHNGPIPLSMCVLHRCDVPGCVNPAHLFLGTQADNMRDMTIKGRSRLVQHPAPSGEGHPCAKLTEAQVLAIRAECANGATQTSLAERFHMSGPAISRIVRRETWVHV